MALAHARRWCRVLGTRLTAEKEEAERKAATTASAALAPALSANDLKLGPLLGQGLPYAAAPCPPPLLLVG
jgi:hypothetical protein